jgi:lysophospholipase L1-like esterase
MRIVFNGGVSGESTSSWDTARGSSQAVSNLLAASPDAVVFQYGINDIIAWNGISPTKAAMVTQTTEYLKSACAAFMGAGVFVIFESINPAAPASISFINGVTAAGGYGANFADKNDILSQVNALMKAWLASWPSKACYVDTSGATTGTDGYAKVDGSYLDGTHMSAYGALNAALLVDTAIRYKFPLRQTSLPTFNRNAIPGFWTNPTAGLGEGIAFVADTGTWSSETYSIDGADQIITMSCTALSAGVARREIDITPLIIGVGAKVPVTAGDIMQARIEYSLSDGDGGKPNCYGISLRPRIFYDDASNEFTAMGQPSVTNSTDWPRMPSHDGSLLSPGLAIKTALASANILATTKVQLLLYANTTGTTQLRIRNAEFRKIA